MRLLPECQFLVLVPELTPETRGLIGAKELAALPKGAIVRQYRAWARARFRCA
ncbi:NAD(P)-dependent oxidoreductase (plasmid) [Bradyrhizobium sp. CB82]|uniref:NAD(P)-dependent oxidoreductase n=1 Tax=Bradyrhizobium sp. CB82 TaxID=3039159 RepID=UPI0024B0E48F|nr:NAD(P)-dependent oxidoreductase [Bradyrhizobium sp. CB82]WFU46085.1 NAD(P)-dependent oxidoreductase [Bradyrhizobium sp. CB82]